MVKVLIIVPTYNEQDNISQLIEVLGGAYPNYDILVVDDGVDETANLVKQAQGHQTNLFLLKRTDKGGRGTAVLAGLKYGLERDYDFLVEMDADFSHDPKDLAALFKLAEPDSVVIGSRYVQGSKIIGWPLRRRIFSRFANFYADLILGIGIKDYTDGYRVYGRTAVARIDFTKIKSAGYIVLSEIAYQLFLQGVKFYEVPIIFINRREGVSNFSLKEIGESLWSVLRIRFAGKNHF